MLKITLYSNCILNEKYESVISTGKVGGTSILEKYLNGLNKIVIPNIDCAYQKTEGKLIFDYEILGVDFYQFNYMKVECYNDDDIPVLLFIRYCFVKDIELDNECVIVSYNEDIWSSYSDAISGFENSLITNSRITNFTSKTFTYKGLPIEYAGNNRLSFEKDTVVDSEKMCVIIQLQTFKKEAADRITTRDTDYYLLSCRSGTININDYTDPTRQDYEKTISAWLVYLRQLISLQSGGIIEYLTDPVEFKSYEVGKIYIVPSAYLPNAIFAGKQTPVMYFDDVTESFPFNFYVEFNLITNSFMRSIYQKSITHDFHNRMIGTFSTQVPCSNNGTSIDYSIYMNKHYDEFSLILNCENNLVDITKDFEYKPAVLSISSSEFSQRKIGYEIADNKRTSNYVQSMFNWGDKMIGKVAGYEYGKASRQTSSVGGILSGISEFVTNIWDYAVDMQGIMAKVYETQYGCFNNNSNLANSYYGICKFYSVTDNDAFVKKCINELGYIVFDTIKLPSDIDLNNPSAFTDRNINYNSIKFSTSNIYGKFSRNIAKKLNEMFEHGIKIWYKETLEEDNYTVG